MFYREFNLAQKTGRRMSLKFAPDKHGALAIKNQRTISTGSGEEEDEFDEDAFSNLW